MNLSPTRDPLDQMKALAYLASPEEAQPAPRMIMAPGSLIWTVAIGKDHTATIIMDGDAHSALGSELVKAAIAERQESLKRLDADMENARNMDAEETVARTLSRQAMLRAEIAGLEAMG